MTLRNITRIVFLLSLTFLFFAFAADRRGMHSTPLAYAQGSSSEPHCQPIGGTVMTNLGVVNQSTTLGVVDGDLSHVIQLHKKPRFRT